MRDVFVELPPGFIGNPQAVPRCPRQKFEGGSPQCPVSTQVGVLRATIVGLGQARGALYNLIPPPGIATQIGFSVVNFNSLQYASVRSEEGYGVNVLAPDIPKEVTSVTETIWGTPADPGHDPERGKLASEGQGPPVASDAPLQPFLTLPANCDTAPETRLTVDSKQNPGVFVGETVHAVDASGQPAPMIGCDGVPFAPENRLPADDEAHLQPFGS